MNKYLLYLFYSWSLAILVIVTHNCYSQEKNAPAEEKKIPKILVLIIASDQLPIYVEEQRLWRSYMHSDPEHIEAYFLKGDINLDTDVRVINDTIWARVTEGWVPQSIGILHKTILGMEVFLPKLREFDYVLRTNLSSFYFFPQLLEFLKTAPHEHFYAGYGLEGKDELASGSGFILSPDLVKLLVQNKCDLLNSVEQDDIIIGKFLISKGVKLCWHERYNIESLPMLETFKKFLPATGFHFRTKNHGPSRYQDEIVIQKYLIKALYDIDISQFKVFRNTKYVDKGNLALIE